MRLEHLGDEEEDFWRGEFARMEGFRDRAELRRLMEGALR